MPGRSGSHSTMKRMYCNDIHQNSGSVTRRLKLNRPPHLRWPRVRTHGVERCYLRSARSQFTADLVCDSQKLAVGHFECQQRTEPAHVAAGVAVRAVLSDVRDDLDHEDRLFVLAPLLCDAVGEDSLAIDGVETKLDERDQLDIALGVESYRSLEPAEVGRPITDQGVQRLSELRIADPCVGSQSDLHAWPDT